MDLIFEKMMAGLLIFLTAIIVVFYSVKSRALPKHHHLLESADAFASGIFLGAALFHMLPDAIAAFHTVLGTDTHPTAELLCAGGFLLLLFLERLSNYSSERFKKLNAIPYMLTLILTVHALIEGAVLGVNKTFATAAVIFFAIIAHKSSESFTLAVILNRSNMALRQVIVIIALFSIMTPLGIALGTLITSSAETITGQFIVAGFNAFAAGTFLYMSTLHHINHHQRQHEGESLVEFFYLVIGLSIMGALAWLA